MTPVHIWYGTQYLPGHVAELSSLCIALACFGSPYTWSLLQCLMDLCTHILEAYMTYKKTRTKYFIDWHKHTHPIMCHWLRVNKSLHASTQHMINLRSREKERDHECGRKDQQKSMACPQIALRATLTVFPMKMFHFGVSFGTSLNHHYHGLPQQVGEYGALTTLLVHMQQTWSCKNEYRV